MFIYIIAILFLCFPIQIQSQNTKLFRPASQTTFEHLTTDNGLSNNNVTCILQDSRGYMWFGTRDGLNKYDGYKITVYRHKEGDLNSIGRNFITSICEDKSGYLWIGLREKKTEGKIGAGLDKFDPEEEKFTHFKFDSTISSSLSSNYVRSIVEDHDGILWIGTNGGLNRFDPVKQEFKRYLSDPEDPFSLSDNRVSSIIETDHGKKKELWIGTYGGLNKFDREKEQFVHYQHDSSTSNTIRDDHVNIIFEDHEGILWIGGSWALNKFDYQKNQIEAFTDNPNNPFSLSDKDIRAIFEDKSGTLWIGTLRGGLNKFDREKERFIHYKPDVGNPKSLNEDCVLSIFEDKTGVLWIGTRGGGVNKINKEKDQFKYYKHFSENPINLRNDYIWSIYEDKQGTVWIGTNHGLNKFDIENDTFKNFHHQPDNPFSLCHDRVRSIVEDEQGKLWIGTNGGLDKFDIKKGQFKHYKHHSENLYSISNNFIRQIFKDKAGTIWIGTKRGINRYDSVKDRFIQYDYDSGKRHSLNNTTISAILESFQDGKHVLWIGTQSRGIYKFDYDSEEIICYRNEAGNPYSLSNNYVWLIYEDRSGEIWFGTHRGLNRFEKESETFVRYSLDPVFQKYNVCKSIYEDNSGRLWVTDINGLNKYDREKDNFINFGTEEGLPNERIDAILEDGFGRLWLCTDNYISKFNPVTERVQNYKLKYGLQTREKIQSIYIKCSNGGIIFGGLNGFVRFNPAELKDNIHAPPIVLTDFQIFNKSVNIKNYNNDEKNDSQSLANRISDTKEIILSYRENVISFEFAALDFRDPAKNRYAYRMEGIDPNWIYTDASRRFVTYTQLNPGKYMFSVKGSNNDGVWNEKGTSIKVIITPPYWETWWFYLCGGMIVLGLLYVAYHNRVSRLQRIAETQKDFSRKLIDSQENERKRIAAALHDSHGQNLLIIKNELEQYLKDHEDSKNELELVRETVKDSIHEIREISYILHPHQLDRLGLKKAILSMVNKIGSSSEIDFNLVIDDIDNLFDKKVEISLYRIIQESLNNIVKHSHATKVAIEIKKNKNYLTIIIDDNGKGFDTRRMFREKKGLGLASMKERAKLLGGRFRVISNAGRGTKIIVRIAL